MSFLRHGVIVLNLILFVKQLMCHPSLNLFQTIYKRTFCKMMSNWVPNPFVNRPKLTIKEIINAVLMLFFVAPVRLFLTTVFVILAYTVCHIAFFGIKEDLPTVPFSGFRKKLKDISNQLTAMSLAILGFHRCHLKGHRAERWEAPIMVMAPHTSFFDVYPSIVLGAPSFVAEKSLFNMPLLGKMLKMSCPISVDRECKDSRRQSIQLIKLRAERMLSERNIARGKIWPQTLIFPEGACGNMTQLLYFKPGAFYPQLPVQPVCLKWHMPYNHIAWCLDAPNEFVLALLTACQLETTITVEFLPAHVPLEDEKTDAVFFAKNVRTVMAQNLRLPTSEYTYEDARFLTPFAKPKLAIFWKLYKALPLDVPAGGPQELKEMWILLQTSQWAEVNYNVIVVQFAEFLQCEMEPSVQRLFNAFDWQCKGLIDLREFLITRHNSPESVGYFRQAFDLLQNENHLIDEIDFIKMIRFPYEKSLNECKAVYELIIHNESYPSFDRVQHVLSNHKDFMHIWLTAQSELS